MRARLGVGIVGCLIAAAIVVVPSLTSASVPAAPATFIVVTQGEHQLRSQLSVYSSITGKRVRTLASFSNAFTNNGLALAPDGSAVYFTLIPKREGSGSLRLMRLDAATGRQSFVAAGAQPAISVDGTQLAYGTDHGLAVRELATAQTRSIRLAQLGIAANLLDASITWLGDGSDVAVVPAPTAWTLVGRPPKRRWCGTSQRNAVVVFVHVPPSPARLTADCVHLKGQALAGRIAVASSPSSAGSLVLANSGAGDQTVVQQISTSGATKRILTIPKSLPLSFDPSGTHLLYLVGHRGPTLTEGAISNGNLIHGSWHRSNLGIGAAAW